MLSFTSLQSDHVVAQLCEQGANSSCAAPHPSEAKLPCCMWLETRIHTDSRVWSPDRNRSRYYHVFAAIPMVCQTVAGAGVDCQVHEGGMDETPADTRRLP